MSHSLLRSFRTNNLGGMNNLGVGVSFLRASYSASSWPASSLALASLLPSLSSSNGGNPHYPRSLAFRLVSTDTSVSAPPTDITANLRRRSELEVNSMVEKSFETKVSEQGKHATNVSDEHVKNASAEEEIKTHSTEHGGPKGLEPTRYNDWERAGRVSDF